MNLRAPFFKGKNSLVILWGKSDPVAVSLDPGARTYRTLRSLDEARGRKFGRVILVLRRELYLFRVVELPKLRKPLLEKTLRLNLNEWSPFRESAFVRFGYSRGARIVNLLAIMKKPDFEAILSAVNGLGLKIRAIVPESLCYSRFVRGKAGVVAAISTAAGVELLHFDEGLRDSQYIPKDEGTPSALDFFIKRIGPGGQALKEIIAVGGESSMMSSGDTPVTALPGGDDVEMILKGSDFFSAPFTRSFAPERRRFSAEDRRALNPALAIVWAGLLFLFGARYLDSYREVRGLRRPAEILRVQTKSLEDRVALMNDLRLKVDTTMGRMEGSPSQIGLLADLQALAPPGTVLQRFVVHKDKMELAGLTPQSAELVTRLNAAGRFVGIKFTSPIQKDPDSGKERFSLETTVTR